MRCFGKRDVSWTLWKIICEAPLRKTSSQQRICISCVNNERISGIEMFRFEDEDNYDFDYEDGILPQKTSFYFFSQERSTGFFLLKEVKQNDKTSNIW